MDIYNCCERKLDRDIDYRPYGKMSGDNNMLGENIFGLIEKIFAEENYRKAFISDYNIINKKLSKYFGYSYRVIQNDLSTNNNITSLIMGAYTVKYVSMLNKKIETHDYITFETWCIVYEKAIIVVSNGSDE